MIIQGAGPRTEEAIPQGMVKKRGKVKNNSRRQMLLKQKAAMEKLLHVDARIEDLSNIFAGMEEQQMTVGSGFGRYFKF